MTFLNNQLFSVILMLSWLIFNSAFCTVPNLNLVKQEEGIQFNSALFLSDPEGEFSIDQVTSDSFSERFLPIPKDQEELMNSSNVFWLKFVIKNQ